MLWVQGVWVPVDPRPVTTVTLTFNNEPPPFNGELPPWYTIWGGDRNELDDLWLAAEEARLERERKDVFRAFVDGRSPIWIELEPEQPPARAIVRRRPGLRASARGVRNWRPRRGTV